MHPSNMENLFLFKMSIGLIFKLTLATYNIDGLDCEIKLGFTMQFLQERLFNFNLFLQCNFLDKGASSFFSNLPGIGLICLLCKPVLPDLAIRGLLGYFFSPFGAKIYLFGILGNFDIYLNICLKLIRDYFAFILCPLPTVE